MMLGPSVCMTLSQAFCTPLPPKRFLSPSRSSIASCSPVDAPLGTAARPWPVAVWTSTSTVGFPRESRISRAMTALISLLRAVLIQTLPKVAHLVHRPDATGGGKAGEQRLSVALTDGSAIEERNEAGIFLRPDQAAEALFESERRARDRI